MTLAITGNNFFRSIFLMNKKKIILNESKQINNLVKNCNILKVVRWLYYKISWRIFFIFSNSLEHREEVKIFRRYKKSASKAICFIRTLSDFIIIFLSSGPRKMFAVMHKTFLVSHTFRSCLHWWNDSFLSQTCNQAEEVAVDCLS